MKKPKRIASVEIDAFESSGNGGGFFFLPDGEKNGKRKRVEVPFTLPHEKANALLLNKRKGIYRTLLEEVTLSSPERIKPRCLHFTTCGGCRWQHLSYEWQLQLKHQSILELFTPFGKVEPIIPSDPWQYRNKMEFSFAMDAKKERYLGLMIDGSRGKVFHLTECHLVKPWFAECVKGVRSWWREQDLEAYHPYKDVGSLRTLTVREGVRSGDRMVILTVSGNPNYALRKDQMDSFVAFVRDAIEPLGDGQLSIFLKIHQIAKGSPSQFFEMHLFGPDYIREKLRVAEKDLTFKISPAAFFQPNTLQGEKIYNLALEMAEVPEGGIVYDLYCGTGTLSICAAQKAKEVIGIEWVLEAVLDAEANGKDNQCNNVQFFGGDVGAVLQTLHEEGRPKPDIVFVDPPRVGLDQKAIEQILNLNPNKIVYISCNPKSQAANLPPFIEKGYRVEKIQPIDQFPQTIHCENIVVLQR